VASVRIAAGGVPTGQGLVLDGSGSVDPDGSIVAYAWDLGDGTTAAGPIVNHIYTRAGTFTVRLTVTDSEGQTSSAQQDVTILDRPPVARFSTYVSTPVGSPLPFDASASFDPDGSIGSYRWSFGDGTTGDGIRVRHAYAGAGVYTVTLTVVDDLGAPAGARLAVTVTAPAQPPVTRPVVTPRPVARPRARPRPKHKPVHRRIRHRRHARSTRHR
jgi:chitodextrinase